MNLKMFSYLSCKYSIVKNFRSGQYIVYVYVMDIIRYAFNYN